MANQHKKTCGIIGTGIAGLASAIRMRNKGYDVTVFEANPFVGGKCSSETSKGYRFDMGPSVFTMPGYIDELFVLSGKNPRDYFNYEQLNPVYKYFFEDGTTLESPFGAEAFAEAMSEHTRDSKEAILKYLDHTKMVYELTEDVFLKNSLHKLRNYFTWHMLKGIINLVRLVPLKP